MKEPRETRVRFWLVWREFSPDTRYKHQTKKSALEEAERLARLHPDQVFFVLKATAAVKTELPPVSRVELVRFDLDTEVPF